MKLRNKKTGEIVTVEFICDYQTDDGTEIGFRVKNTLNYYSYSTLAELNEEWEDVEGINVTNIPLIKDEKIRKAVRAWANSFDDADEIKASDDYKDFWLAGYLIEFERSFDEEERGHTYRRTNIAELCGEEEE